LLIFTIKFQKGIRNEELREGWAWKGGEQEFEATVLGGPGKGRLTGSWKKKGHVSQIWATLHTHTHTHTHIHIHDASLSQ
jgi:hypothetical protein